MWYDSLMKEETSERVFFLWAPNTDVAQRLADVFEADGLPMVDQGDDTVLCMKGAHSETIIRSFEGKISIDSLDGVKVLVTNSTKPCIADFRHIVPLKQLIFHISAQWLNDILISQNYWSLMQPIISAHDHALVHGYEMLLRGKMDDGIEVPPGLLFQTAAESGLSFVLDLAAVEAAVMAAAEQKTPAKIFVNVLPETLLTEGGIEALLSTIDLAKDVEPFQIVFELVESQHIKDIDAFCEIRKRLRERSVGLAIDDFGSGFNNLGMINDIAPDYLKLDASLARDLSNNPKKWNLIASVVDAARASGISVIAEGIETEDMARTMHSLGVDYMQGYYFGYPREQAIGILE